MCCKEELIVPYQNRVFLKLMIKIMYLKLNLLLTFFVSVCCAQEVIPYPNHYEKTGGKLSIPRTLTISSHDNEFAGLIPGFIQSAQTFYSVAVKPRSKNGFIRLIRNTGEKDPEGYRLTIAPGGITVETGYPEGCFYGLQTVLQLTGNAGAGGSLPCAFIQDSPGYSWRGLMLDESRHFIGKTEVMKLLDFMALHKLNKFHWHLTDAQGWRIEIKQYPLLTEVGGRGDLTNPDGPALFYTQREIKEIVKYAEERFIDIIPEIDMPGHATAAVKAYPEFSGGGSRQYPDFTFNPGKKETYGFLTDILNEIVSLFPSRYIHIGGDEVHFGNEHWNDIDEVGQLMQVHHLKDLVDVEHYFINRMADSVRAMGKTVVGWDEVVTAGLPASGTVVMWWRHDKPQQLKEALGKGYKVVLCPRIPLYFDFVQYRSHSYGRKWSDGAFAPIERVYRFPDPELTGGVSVITPLVLGIQGNLWTERIDSPERLQFMAFPRLSALAEAAWTKDDIKDYESFNSRMQNMLSLYKRMGLAFFDYRNPASSPEVAGPSKK